MRIISGIAGGRRLFTPTGDKTRPTSDKIRGSLFNILSARVPGARVLDVFGGTGALALEAMSRGADSAVIADLDGQAVDIIKRNAAQVLGEDYASRVTVIRGDFRRVIAGQKGPAFDMVFLDPPYAMTEAYARVLELLARAGLLTEDAVIVSERQKDADVKYPAGFEVFDTRRYGDTAVDMLRRSKE
jgi:16S rRNA (guanine966-N2)-methyltransferase